MARLTKSRARTPLAVGMTSLSTSYMDSLKYCYSIRSDEETPGGRSVWYRLEFDDKEALRVVDHIAGAMSDVERSLSYDKRTLPEKLRALADKLEAEANGAINS